MAKKEVKTDLWVASQLKECGIKYDAQGSDVKELDEALKTASKRGTGKAGYPEYVSVVDDYVIVIEDKADLDKQKKLTKDGIIDVEVKAVTDYAVMVHISMRSISLKTARSRRFLLLACPATRSIMRLHRSMLMTVKATRRCLTLSHSSLSHRRIFASITRGMYLKKRLTSRRQQRRFSRMQRNCMSICAPMEH